MTTLLVSKQQLQAEVQISLYQQEQIRQIKLLDLCLFLISCVSSISRHSESVVRDLRLDTGEQHSSVSGIATRGGFTVQAKGWLVQPAC